MGIFDFGKEQEIQKGLEELLEGKVDKVRVSKKDLLDFLKKEETKVEEIVAPVQEEVEAEEVAVIEEEPVAKEEEEPVEEEVVQPPQIMDRLLDEYEDQSKPTVAKTGDGFLAYGGGGENNSIVEVGSGVGLYKDKDGPRLRFKTLLASGSVTLTDNGDTVTIGATDVSGTDSWPSVSADYYTSNQVDVLISAVSGDADSWPSVSADYYSKLETYSQTEVDALISAVSADSDTWPSVSADYYTSNQVDVLISAVENLEINSQIVSYSATSADDIILCSASNVTLPAAVDVDKKIFNIKNRSTESATVDVAGGGTIDKETSQVIIFPDNLQVISDGTEYWIL